MFTDRRIAIVILLIWLVLLAFCFVAAGGTGDNTFIRFGFGPSPTLSFLGIIIDTWAKWSLLSAFVCIDMGVNVWANEIIGPWINNTIYDHDKLDLEYSRRTAMAITNLYFLYTSLRGIITVYLAFTQIDVLLLRILVDVCVTLATSWTYIGPKKCRLAPLQEIRVVPGTYGAC